MRVRKWMAALLALCLLLAAIPAATMEDLAVDAAAGQIELEIDGDPAGDVVLDLDEADGLTLDGVDLSGLDGALPGSDGADGDLALNVDVGETLVHIVRPADGEVVNADNVDIWLTWTFPGGDASEIVAKLLPTTVELLWDGVLYDTKQISPSTLVFTDNGACYLNMSLSDSGTYTLRASVPGSGGYSKVTFTVIKPKPSVTPKPTPPPDVDVDENGFGVDQTGVLRAYTGDSADIVIPDSVNAIGEEVFKDSTVKRLVTHGGVKRILNSAFNNCGPLDSVTLAKGLKSIGEDAFYASELKELTIPEGVTKIESGAFHRCGQMESISIPSSVASMGTYMFGFSHKLKTVTFAEGCKLDTFDKDMFYHCVALKDVNIPDSVKTLGEFAFANCIALTALTLPDGLTTISDYAFENCTGLKELTIPASVKQMEIHTFEGCSNLTLNVVAGSYGEQYVKEMESIPYKVISEPTPAPKVSLSKCKATVKDQVYTGKALKPAVTVKYGKKTLKKGTDYTVTYSNNTAVGTAMATLRGKGKYTGTKKVSFKILPPKVALSSVKAGSKSFTATWKKSAVATGYQLQYGLKKSFSGAKTVRVKKAKTVSATVKSLQSGKTYYVRVRVYRTVNRKNYYSAWSAVKRVKVK